jgi:hypothetical protein
MSHAATRSFEKERCLSYAEQVLQAMLEHPEIKAVASLSPYGCCVYVAEMQEPRRTVLWNRFGPCTDSESRSPFDTAQAEVANLARYPELKLSHFCRHEGSKFYQGGAVRGTNYYFYSISGWDSPDLNELHTLLTAVAFGGLKICEARDYLRSREGGSHTLPCGRIVSLHKNSHAHLLYDLNSALAA